jgi:hypothetical protein
MDSGESAVDNLSTSIIVMQDDFTGTTIDTGKWTETDPVDSVEITQNNELIFSIDTNGTAVPSSNTNNIETVSSVASGCIQMDFGGTLSAGTDANPALSFFGDFSNLHLAQIIYSGSGKTKFTVYSGGSLVYNPSETIYDFAGTWRIRHQSGVTYFEELTAVNTWTIRDQHTADITNGNNLKARFGSSSFQTTMAQRHSPLIMFI